MRNMELWLLLSLMAFCLCQRTDATGQFVETTDQDPIAEERHRILVVKKGRTAYLNPRVVLENPPSEGTCMIQVVNDPMTQRVGTLTPQVSSYLYILHFIFLQQICIDNVSFGKYKF